MKTKVDPTKEQQHIPVRQPAQKTPATGATATLADHRPQTVYQRQLLTGIRQSPQVLQAKAMQEKMKHSARTQKDASLLASMQSHAKAKAAPVQRMTAKGSSRFRQIAAAMGAAYGVDTSGLKATHHSPFPARLHAEATIQGRNIHFAPGKDTDHNIRHEVAHAIDNTINGTPKGDQVVNGQMVDTTREQVVNGMISDSRSVIQRNASSAPRAPSFSEDVFQLKPLDTKIDSNKLNVVGENHGESDDRRDLEKLYAQEKFETEKSYWEEHELAVYYEDLGLTWYGDSKLMRTYFALYMVWFHTRAIIAELSRSMPSSSVLHKCLKKAKSKIDECQSGRQELSFAQTEGYYIDKLAKINVDKSYTRFYNTFLQGFYKFLQDMIKGDHEKLDEPGHRDTLKSKAENAYEEVKTFLQSQLGYFLQEEDLKALFNETDLQGKALLKIVYPITKLRDDAMQHFAWSNASFIKGIWKVGDGHIGGIKASEDTIPNFRRTYNLIDKKSFDQIFNEWRETIERMENDDSVSVFDWPEFLDIINRRTNPSL